MSLLTVLTAPDPRLKQVAAPVTAVTDEIRQLMNDMLETMYANDGMGLAATQVGVLKRVVVMDMNAGEEGLPTNPIKMANPEILWRSEDTSALMEGCLSVPGQRGEVVRAVSLKLRYLDENNTLQEIDADGILATCIQHEIDHLDGILYIDHLSRLKREIILKKLQKLKR
ncbi:peptide deformylase [Candidatus Paracaedibacter symbiosus]|uniref:peptide deformylase n=1 Tax=Candidatus Paracaedibacter symbiosus TaxID=244582 RepID=UPI000509934F|nr:peptide deformylase [Candidatus Paracaedibacter symbiosus]